MAITVGKLATTQANFNISNIIGVDLANSYPVYQIPGSAAVQNTLYYPETNNPQFALGTHVFGTNDTEFVMCVVGTTGSINQYDLVAIDQNYNVTQSYIASASAANVSMYGVNLNNTPGVAASVAGIAASQPSVTVNFCWIAIRGNELSVNTNAAVTINSGATLYIGTTPGTIGTASTGSALLVVGLNNPASVTAATVMGVIAAAGIFTPGFM